MKRIALFILSNLLVLLLLSQTARLLGVERYLTAHGLNLNALFGFALVMGFGGSFFTLWLSKPIARWTMDLRPLDPDHSKPYSAVWVMVKTHAVRADIAMPEVAIYDGPPNAFATGPSKNSALVAVSTGLLETLTPEEQDAVIAHEIAHIVNGDMVTMILLQGVLNTFVLFLSRVACYAIDGMFRKDEDLELRPGWAYWTTVYVLEILLGFGASAVLAWFSRQREFRADAEAARLLCDSKPMIQALAHLDEHSHAPWPMSMATLAVHGRMDKWFATHPPIAKRIARLKSLG